MSLIETEPAREEKSAGDTALSASPRLFENPLLDRLSRTPWQTPLVLYGPAVAALGWLSLQRLGSWAVMAAAIAGYAIWTLTEYLGHRFLFHAKFPGSLGARIHFLIHGVHHVHPSDPLRLVMPPLLSAPILLIALAVARFVFGPVLGFPMLMGFVVGYIGYDLTHYYLHHGRPRTAIGRAAQRNHLLHHFRDHERGFGVSAPYWDHVFGTRHQLLGGADRL
jgi:dihydroceramide fatty acyl 2-hydroxylase